MELTYGIEGTYIDDGTGIRWEGPIENELPACKAIATANLLDSFDNELTYYGTHTTTEGWIVDARRQDLDNLRNLCAYLINTNVTTATVRMHDNSFVEMSITRLAALCTELQGKGIALYQKKWQKLADIEAATTIEAVKAITW